MADDNCLDCPSPNSPVKLIRCHNMGGNQKWEYREVSFFFLAYSHPIIPTINAL